MWKPETWIRESAGLSAEEIVARHWHEIRKDDLKVLAIEYVQARIGRRSRGALLKAFRACREEPTFEKIEREPFRLYLHSQVASFQDGLRHFGELTLDEARLRLAQLQGQYRGLGEQIAWLEAIIAEAVRRDAHGHEVIRDIFADYAEPAEV